MKMKKNRRKNMMSIFDSLRLHVTSRKGILATSAVAAAGYCHLHTHVSDAAAAAGADADSACAHARVHGYEHVGQARSLVSREALLAAGPKILSLLVLSSSAVSPDLSHRPIHSGLPVCVVDEVL